MARTARDIFTILMQEHELGLLAFVRSCVVDHAAADDIVQETFLAAWRELEQYDRERPFGAWVRGIAKKKILGHYRTAATAHRHVRLLTPEAIDQIAEEHESLTSGPGDSFVDRLTPLRECLEALPTTDRDLLQRHYRQQQSCRAIAGQLGSRLETVKKRLQRTRAALRDCILGKLEPEASHG